MTIITKSLKLTRSPQKDTLSHKTSMQYAMNIFGVFLRWIRTQKFGIRGESSVIGKIAYLQALDLLVSDTWLDTGIGYWYRYPMTRYYERLLDTGSS